MLVLELGRKTPIGHLTFAPDGCALVAASEWSADRWPTIADGLRATRLLSAWYVHAAQETADGRWVFAGRSTLWRIDLATNELFRPPLREPGQFVHFDVSPVAPLVLVAQHPAGSSHMTRLALWRADDFSPAGCVWEREFDEVSSFRPQFLAGGDRFVRLEGGWLGDRHSAHRVAAYATATGELVGRSAAIPFAGSGSAVSPDGRWVLRPGTNYLDACPLDPAVGSDRVRLRNDSRKHFTAAALHPSGKYLAATSNDATVKLYDTTTWDVARAFTWEIGKMRSVCFSPDGTLAAAGSDRGQAVVWDVDL